MDGLTPAEFLAVIAKELETLHAPASVRLRTPGRMLRYRIVPGENGLLLSPEETGQDSSPEMTEMHRNLLEAALEQPETGQTGQQLAERAGYVYNPRIRGCLSNLRKWGLLDGRPGDTGYRPTIRARKGYTAPEA